MKESEIFFLRSIAKKRLNEYLGATKRRIEELRQYLQEKESDMIEETLGEYANTIYKMLPDKWIKLLSNRFYFTPDSENKDKTLFLEMVKEDALRKYGLSWYRFTEKEVLDSGFSSIEEVQIDIPVINEILSEVFHVSSVYNVLSKTQEEAVEKSRDSNEIGLIFTVIS